MKRIFSATLAFLLAGMVFTFAQDEHPSSMGNPHKGKDAGVAATTTKTKKTRKKTGTGHKTRTKATNSQ